MKKFFEYLILFSIGGIIYILMEMLWRGRSHWSMFLLGGLCFVLIGALNERCRGVVPLFVQSIFGAFIITTLEFVTGCIVNIRFGLGVWDYSDVPFNIMGQVCLPYAVGWFLLSPVCVIADDYMREAFFGEPRPKYKIF